LNTKTYKVLKSQKIQKKSDNSVDDLIIYILIRIA